MYLSRLIVDPRDRAARRDLGDCHALHRTLLAAYPQGAGGNGARAAFGVLYRVETEPRTGHAAVLVQSTTAPEWSQLPAGYLLTSLDGAENPAVKTIDKLLNGLREGMRLRFRLRANPTKRVSQRSAEPKDEKMRGKRVDLRREEDQIAWLRRKGEAGGFALAAVRAAPDVANVRGQPEAAQHGGRRGERLTFGSVLFEGEMTVIDTAAFRQTLAAGIGSGKAYGFGLLSVAPAGG